MLNLVWVQFICLKRLLKTYKPLRTCPRIRFEQWLTDCLNLFPVLQPPFPSAPSVSAWARAEMLLKEKVYLSGIHSAPRKSCMSAGAGTTAGSMNQWRWQLMPMLPLESCLWNQAITLGSRAASLLFFFSWFSALISSFFAWIGVLACWRGRWGVEAAVGSGRHGKQQLLKVPLQPQTYIAKKIFPNLVWSAIQFPNA